MLANIVYARVRGAGITVVALRVARTRRAVRDRRMRADPGTQRSLVRRTPRRAVRQGPVFRGSGRVVGRRAGIFVQSPAADQAGSGGDRLLHPGLDLSLAERAVPDPHLVQNPLEGAEPRAGRRQHGTEPEVLDTVGTRSKGTDYERGFRVSIQIQPPRRSVVARGGVIPGVEGDLRCTRHRMVEARGGILEIGGEDVSRCVDSENIVRIHVRSVRLRCTLRNKWHK